MAFDPSQIVNFIKQNPLPVAGVAGLAVLAVALGRKNGGATGSPSPAGDFGEVTYQIYPSSGGVGSGGVDPTPTPTPEPVPVPGHTGDCVGAIADQTDKQCREMCPPGRRCTPYREKDETGHTLCGCRQEIVSGPPALCPPGMEWNGTRCEFKVVPAGEGGPPPRPPLPGGEGQPGRYDDVKHAMALFN